MIVRCVVAAINGDGEPDLYFVKVECSQDQYDTGIHYEAAEEAADKDGYDPMLAYDEYDPAGTAMMHMFEWDTASLVSAGNQE